MTQTCLVFLRDSKLTRILEDSIGGNCKTTMMAMISPALEAYSGKAPDAAFAHVGQLCFFRRTLVEHVVAWSSSHDSQKAADVSSVVMLTA